jgi:hypothetical protein
LAEELQVGIVNCCCPYFQVAACADTEEHKHIVCQAQKGAIPNDYAVLYCVSDHKWGGCPIFAEECTIRNITRGGKR